MHTGGNYVYTISRYTGSSTNIFSDITLSSQSDSIFFVRDDTRNVLCVILGDELRLYSIVNGELIAAYNSTQLGGVPYDMAITNSNTNRSSSSNGGCEISGAGMILFFAFSGMLHGRRKI